MEFHPKIIIGKQTIALLKKNFLQQSSNFFNDIDNGSNGFAVLQKPRLLRLWEPNATIIEVTQIIPST